MIPRKVVLNVLCEFGPIVAFMVAYSFYSFKIATVAMIIAVVIALFVLKYTEKHFPLFAIISTIGVAVFGVISIVVDIPSIFILRDTIFDTIFGTVLIVSVFLKKPLLKVLFKNVFAITERGWSKLSFRWGLYYLVAAGINEWIRLTRSPDDWVHLKVFLIIITVAFGFYQFGLIRRERLPEATPWGLLK